ncbi:adenine deaminase [Escherichia coli]|nr:adenine deaminase [Escherichia coli]
MNNSINHKFHHISRAEYQELLAVSRGDAVADYIIDNAVSYTHLDVYKRQH